MRHIRKIILEAFGLSEEIQKSPFDEFPKTSSWSGGLVLKRKTGT
jgi:hypothetical protein